MIPCPTWYTVGSGEMIEMKRSLAIAGIGLIAACSTDSGIKAYNAEPQARITSHSDDTEVEEAVAFTLRGKACDADDSPEAVPPGSRQVPKRFRQGCFTRLVQGLPRAMIGWRGLALAPLNTGVSRERPSPWERILSRCVMAIRPVWLCAGISNEAFHGLVGCIRRLSPDSVG